MAPRRAAHIEAARVPRRAQVAHLREHRRPRVPQRLPHALVLFVRHKVEEHARCVLARVLRENAVEAEGDAHDAAAPRAPPVLVGRLRVAQDRGVVCRQAPQVVDSRADVAAHELAAVAAHAALVVLLARLAVLLAAGARGDHALAVHPGEARRPLRQPHLVLLLLHVHQHLRRRLHAHDGVGAIDEHAVPHLERLRERALRTRRHGGSRPRCGNREECS
eukprot:916617-Prymnesium_polylepis.1